VVVARSLLRIVRGGPGNTAVESEEAVIGVWDGVHKKDVDIWDLWGVWGRKRVDRLVTGCGVYGDCAE
jgi:hypothetical protein